ncbi:MAG: hypothetical protein LBG45_00490 [Dysgonamonadaceae bacterium]|nr:hypothetical protein [Dysgonamonadaceae bacterium]
MKKIIINSWIASLLRSIGRIFVTAGNNPVRDYSSVETFDRTAPRMTSVMRTNAASLRDAGEGRGTLFSTELCISTRCRVVF